MRNSEPKTVQRELAGSRRTRESMPLPSDPIANDALTAALVSDALHFYPGLDARGLSVYVQDSEVTLIGVIRDLAAERLARHLAARCAGVRAVFSELRLALSASGQGRAAAQ